jgi:hypothetical protein
MTDCDDAKSTDGYDYDRDGHVIPPAGSFPWDFLTISLAMAIPFIAMRSSIYSPFPPLGLQRFTVFQLLTSRDLLSEDQVRNIEFLLVILIVARLASFPAYFKKYTSLYSEQRRPPDVWRKAWPRQIRLLFLIAPIGIGCIELVAVLIQHLPNPYIMTARDVYLPILILALGVWFLTGSLLSAALYSVFYRSYWRHST